MPLTEKKCHSPKRNATHGIEMPLTEKKYHSQKRKSI